MAGRRNGRGSDPWPHMMAPIPALEHYLEKAEESLNRYDGHDTWGKGDALGLKNARENAKIAAKALAGIRYRKQYVPAGYVARLKRVQAKLKRRNGHAGRRRNAGKALHYIIVYDVYSDDRRKALHWRLSKWMQPIQRSVMEAALTKAELGKVVTVVESIISGKDTVKFYKQQSGRPVIVLGSAKALKFAQLGKKKKPTISPLANPRRRNRRRNS
jgi:CRISPR/Cas system-associated endoribonuclease Cas2